MGFRSQMPGGGGVSQDHLWNVRPMFVLQFGSGGCSLRIDNQQIGLTGYFPGDLLEMTPLPIHLHAARGQNSPQNFLDFLQTINHEYALS